MREYAIGLYEKAMPPTLSWREKLAFAKEAGYDFVEISIDEKDEKLARLDWTREERLELVEELDIGETMPLWVAEAMENGQIAQPLGTIMPNLVTGGGDAWRTRWPVFVTVNDTGEICTPYLGEDQYLCVL